MPLVSVLIINWNGAEVIGDCIASVLRSAYAPIETIVVDDCSTDGSVKIVEEVGGPRVRLVKIGANIGYAKACNIGAAQARGDYLAILNNDCTVDRQWLSHAVLFFASDPNIGIVGCRQMNAAEPEIIDSLLQYVNDSLGFEDFSSGMRYTGIPASRVFAPAGASMLCRTTLFRELRGFDERFQAYYEEADFCFRAFSKGWGCILSPQSVVFHRGSYSFNKQSKNKYYLLGRNRYRFMLNNYPLGYLRAHWYRLLRFELGALKYVFVHPTFIFAYVRSKIAAVPLLYEMICERKGPLKLPVDRIDLFERLRREKYIPLS